MDTPDLKDLVEKVDERLKIVREEERRLQEARNHLTAEKPMPKRRGRPPKQETTEVEPLAKRRRRRRQAVTA